MGHDAHCAAWIRKFREAPPEGEAMAGQRGRRAGGGRRSGGGAPGTTNGAATA